MPLVVTTILILMVVPHPCCSWIAGIHTTSCCTYGVCYTPNHCCVQPLLTQHHTPVLG